MRESVGLVKGCGVSCGLKGDVYVHSWSDFNKTLVPGCSIHIS